MPRATVNTEPGEKIELKSCPEGYVRLKSLSYGELLHRRQMATKMNFQGGRGGSMAGELQMVNAAVQQYEFSKCIVEHNLEDDSGALLDFKNPAHVALLDPRIGEEINRHIDKLNQLDDEDDDRGNS